jgi:hypothetical protein
MKAIVLHFTDGQGKATKTYSAVSIKTGLVDRIFDLASTAKELENGSQDMALIRQFFSEVKAVIVALFGNQFTYDELQDGVEQNELMRCFTSACTAITGELSKNA